MGTRRYGVRPPAVAGLFYPEDPERLEGQVASMIAQAPPPLVSHDSPPKALIVPHAGYRYSGLVAATAYSLLPSRRARSDPPLVEGLVEGVAGAVKDPTIAFILGPPHRSPVAKFALPDNSALRTPLGVVPVDEEIAASLLSRPTVTLDRVAHAAEHSLEVQLPFLQTVFGMHLRVVPLIVGDAGSELTAELIEDFWDRPNVVFVVSSDLSHFLDDSAARERDKRTLEGLARGNATLTGEDACGFRALNGLSLFAHRRGLALEVLGHANSADRQGPPERVVGYGSLGIWDPAATMVFS